MKQAPAVIVTDWEKIIFTNAVFPEITNLSEEILISKDFLNHIDSDSGWDNIQETGYVELDFFMVSGEKKRLNISCQKSKDVWTLTIFEDTRTKNCDGSAQEKRVIEQHRFLETAPIGLYRVTFDGHVIQANKTLISMLGFDSLDELKSGFNAADAYLDSSIRTHQLAQWKESKEFGEPFEFQVKRKDGSVIWVRDQGVLEFDDNGEISIISGVLTDVTSEHEIRDLLWDVKSNLEETVEKKDQKLITSLRQERILTKRLKTILDSIPDVAWLKDKNFNIIAVNQAYVNLVGMNSADDCIGKTDFDIWPEEIAMVYRENDIEVFENRKKIVIEEPVIDPQKKVFFYETIKLPIFDDLNEIIGISGIARNITTRKKHQEELEILVAERTRDLEKINDQLVDEIEEHKRLEIALDESNKRFKSLINLSPDIMLEIDENGKIMDISAGKGYFFISNPDILKGGNVSGLAFGDGEIDATRALELIKKTISTDRLQSLEFSIVENELTRHFHARVVKKNNNSVVAFIRDITVLKSAHKKIEESERKFKDLFSLSPEPKIIRSLDERKIIDANEAMLSLLKMSYDDILGLTLEELSKNSDIYLTDESLHAIYNSAKVTDNLEVEFIYESFEARYALYSSNVVLVDQKLSIISVFRDITERKRQQILLNQSNKFLDTIVATIHESVFVKDLEGRYTYYKWPKFEEQGILDTSTILGKKIEDIEPNKERVLVANKMFRRVIETREKVMYLTSLKLTSLQVSEIMQVTLSPMFDENGEVISVVGVAKSLAEKLEAEERIKVSEERYKKLSEGINSPIFVHDGKRFVYSNRAFSEAIGYSQDELEEIDIYKILHPDMVSKMREQFEKRVAGESVPVNAMVTVVTKSGEELIWNILISMMELDGSTCSLISVNDITKLKNKEHALIESRNNYIQLINAIPDLIFTLSSKGEYINFRALDESELYIASNEIVGSSIFTSMPEKIANDVMEKIGIVLETKKTHDYEYSLDFHGQKKHFHARIGYRDENSVISVVRDITELKTIQNKLKTSNDFLDRVVATMYEIVWAKDLEGRYTYYRWPEFEQLGYDMKDHIGKKIEDYAFQKENKAHVELSNKMFNKVLETKKSLSYRTETYLKDFDKTELMQISLSPLLDSDGNVTGVVGVGKSVTKQFLAEEKAKRFEKRYAGIVGAIDDIIFELRKDKIAFVSPSIEKILGVSTKTFIGRDIFDVADEWQANATEDIRNGKTSFEFSVIDSVGKERYFDARISRSGQSIFGVAREITRRKYMEQAKERYHSSLMHELKNPLVLIQGYSEMLESKLEGDELDMVKIIQESAKKQDYRLTELGTKNASSRAYNFKITSAFDQIKKAADYLAKLFPMLSQKFHGHNTSVFTSNIDENLKNIQILIDIESMDEVFENLLSNAVKYSPSDRVEINLTAKKLDLGRIEIAISDKGCGIPEDQIAKIFKPFFRVDCDNILTIEGTGIGLANAKLHVEVNDGDIKVESIPDEGSTFKVILPVYANISEDEESENPLLD